MATRRQTVDNSPAFRWIIKVIYILYLVLYMTYALINFMHNQGSFLINVLVISFTSVSALILIATTIMDYVVSDNETLSTAKVTLHTLKNIFKVIKVAISVIVLIHTINDNSWSIFNIIVVVMSLPLSLLLLLIEYIYVSIANRIRNRRSGTISFDNYDDEEAALAALAAKNKQNSKKNAFWASILTWELTGDEDVDEMSDTYDAVKAVQLKKKLLPENYVEPEPILEEELAELRYIRRAVSRNAKVIRHAESAEKTSADNADYTDVWPRVVPSEGMIYPIPNALITISRPRKRGYDRRKGNRLSSDQDGAIGHLYVRRKIRAQKNKSCRKSNIRRHKN